MIELDEALRRVLSKVRAIPSEKVPLAKALFRTLSEDVVSDIDAPPHDKAMMDGFAVRSADISEAPTTLKIAGTISAGENTSIDVLPGNAVRIMTGAPLPAGADAVVMREKTSDPPSDAGEVTIETNVEAEANVMRRATNMAVGDVVLEKGARIRATEIGILSEVGRLEVSVSGIPKAGILATGNELVPVNQKPPAGKIRNSNGPMLCAQARSSGCHAFNLGIAADDKALLRKKIEQGLQYDFLILSGGVSAGDFDLVPSALQELSVEEIFHKIRIKPGKPLWFGTGPAGTLVFGLPGNPVSSLVCFELLVRPAIMKTAGRACSGYEWEHGTIVGDIPSTGDRRTFWPARSETKNRTTTLELLPWRGSSDLRSLSSADCLADMESADSATGAVSFVKLH